MISNHIFDKSSSESVSDSQEKKINWKSLLYFKYFKAYLLQESYFLNIAEKLEKGALLFYMYCSRKAGFKDTDLGSFLGITIWSVLEGFCLRDSQ